MLFWRFWHFFAAGQAVDKIFGLSTHCLPVCLPIYIYIIYLVDKVDK